MTLIKKQKTFVKKEITQLLLKSGLDVLLVTNTCSLGYFDVLVSNRITSPVFHFFKDNKIRLSFVDLYDYNNEIVLRITVSKDY
jgi:hypothetical protein